MALQAEKELTDNYLPVLSTVIKNMDEYDTIFIGYPIWRGTFPQVIVSFLKEYDLSGKTIVPFCTYGGTGLGSTVSKIQGLAPNSTVVEGLAILGTDVNNSQGAINDWLNKLGITK